MTLVADSGSTKTTWMETVTGNKTVTQGLNPHFTTDDQYEEVCHSVLASFGKPDEIYFYGAGCGDERQRARVGHQLQNAFRTERISVETDMLGCCRAVSQQGAALVGILGTGSNACYYDGIRITRQAVSTGYILGDEGSANHVGRKLLNGYLTHHMPEALRTLFHDTYPLTDSEMIDAVYHRSHPNRFLASLAPFAVQHPESDYCRQQITQTLEEWIIQMVMPLKSAAGDDTEIHVVGGYAHAVEPLLRTLLESHGLQAGKIEADPIEGLRNYHLQRQNP
ncbi:MAG: hypothetical protein K5867_01035 [Bacteroidales bacterium]|nr:hypothetical protein [Bacteroidales bacterium]